MENIEIVTRGGNGTYVYIPEYLSSLKMFKPTQTKDKYSLNEPYYTNLFETLYDEIIQSGQFPRNNAVTIKEFRIIKNPMLTEISTVYKTQARYLQIQFYKNGARMYIRVYPSRLDIKEYEIAIHGVRKWLEQLIQKKRERTQAISSYKNLSSLKQTLGHSKIHPSESEHSVEPYIIPPVPNLLGEAITGKKGTLKQQELQLKEIISRPFVGPGVGGKRHTRRQRHKKYRTRKTRSK
jgi:hypothetical protein